MKWRQWICLNGYLTRHYWGWGGSGSRLTKTKGKMYTKAYLYEVFMCPCVSFILQKTQCSESGVMLIRVHQTASQSFCRVTQAYRVSCTTTLTNVKVWQKTQLCKDHVYDWNKQIWEEQDFFFSLSLKLAVCMLSTFGMFRGFVVRQILECSTQGP